MTDALPHVGPGLMVRYDTGRRCFACFEYDDDRCTLEC